MTAGEFGFWLVAGGGACFRVMAVAKIRQVVSPEWRLGPRPPSNGAGVGALPPLGGRVEGGGGDTAIRVSVCVPARDEAEVIDRVLHSLDLQDHAAIEVIVVDDRSTDGTGDRARNHRCRVIEGTDPPEGWLGKQWALQGAAKAATGEILCFVDADTWHDAAAIRTCAEVMDGEGVDVLVVVSGHALGSWAERWVLPFFWAALLSFLDMKRAHDPALPDDAMGNGQFWLVRRSLYESIGGHEAVKDRLAEDVAIVRALKRAGGHYRLRFGPDLTRTRMYTGLASLWKGFQKNAAVVDPDRPGLSISLTVLAAGLSAQAELWPWLVFALAPLGGIWAHPAALGLAAIQLGAIFAGRYLVYSRLCDGASGARISLNPISYLGQPLGAAIGIAAMINSLQAQLRGATSWKGRRVRGRSL